MLALANKHGEVMASVPGLAKVASLPIDATRRGIEKLESPDPDSRTPDEEGRRIIKIPGGWDIVNYAKHRRMASSDEERAMNAARQKRWYQRHKGQKPNAKPNGADGFVTPPNDSLTVQTDNAEAEAEAKAEKSNSEEKGSAEGKGKVPAARRKGPTLTDDQFLSELKQHYPGVDIGRELHRMDAWLLTPQAKGRQRTRRFVVNWLNKCDQPMAGNGNGERRSMANGYYANSSRLFDKDGNPIKI